MTKNITINRGKKFYTISQLKEIGMFNKEIILEKYFPKEFHIEAFYMAFINSIDKKTELINLDKLNKEFNQINIKIEYIWKELLSISPLYKKYFIHSAVNTPDSIYIFILPGFEKIIFDNNKVKIISEIFFILYSHEENHKQDVNKTPKNKLDNSNNINDELSISDEEYDRDTQEINACARETANYLLINYNNNLKWISQILNDNRTNFDEIPNFSKYVFNTNKTSNKKSKHRFLKKLYDFLELDKE